MYSTILVKTSLLVYISGFQVSVYRTIGPLVFVQYSKEFCNYSVFFVCFFSEFALRFEISYGKPDGLVVEYKIPEQEVLGSIPNSTAGMVSLSKTL